MSTTHPRGRSRMISEGVAFDKITILILCIRTDLSNRCRPRSNATDAVSDQGLHCLPLMQ